MKVIGAYYKSSEIDVFVYEEGSMNRLYGLTKNNTATNNWKTASVFTQIYGQHELLFHSL